MEVLTGLRWDGMKVAHWGVCEAVEWVARTDTEKVVWLENELVELMVLTMDNLMVV